MSTFGSVSLRDFDKGVIDTFGSELIPFNVDGGTRQVYSKAVNGLTTNVPQYQGRVPVFFAYPEDVFQNYRIPCIVVRRTSLSPAFDRAPWYGYQRAPSVNASPVELNLGNQTINGYDSYTTKWNPTPFNIGYDIQISAPSQNDGLLMLRDLLAYMRPPFFTTNVIDSVGDVRGYDSGEVSISEASEINDVASRMIGWTISFEVRGELDLELESVSSIGDANNAIITAYPQIMTYIYRYMES